MANTSGTTGKGTRSDEVQTILRLRVPFIVLLGHRRMSVDEVLEFAPGRIIELPQHYNDYLRVRINNCEVAQGEAVKIGENFGIRITKLEDRHVRIKAMGPGQAEI